MSTDLHTLSGAYAVDALSAEEAAEFRTHLEGCEACRQEVRELREAAALMGASEAVSPPPALKERVLAEADRTPQLPPRVTSLDERRAHRRLPRLLGAAAAVILAGGAVFGIGQMQSDQPDVPASVAQVFQATDAHTTRLRTTNGGTIVVATSRGLGRMAVDTDELPPLAGSKVYQLWTIAGGTPRSAGLLTDVDEGKAMELPAPGTQVAITVEPAGGSVAPTTEPIVAVEPG